MHRYCVVIVVQESRTCAVTATVDEQYIASASSVYTEVSTMSNCGTKSHPWRLESGVGQRLRVNILDFTGPVDTPSANSRDITCRQYGYVLERSTKRNVSMCMPVAGNEAKRESEIYLSDTNNVNIVLDPGTRSDYNNFLVIFNGILFVSYYVSCLS